ncbi:MAG TPA: hypothetical protein PK385_06935 [Spirochaetota bacterium]|nr:hypothetical protein [Spirochaetota bacterium]HOS31824.1 hypothetical protein [Spirochaetota bacterium]HOS55778.1 hypothetical protein [Spirochaetota bacterium]HPK62690.1 hypothetical protein [Spirochaetota bacterium]HQF76710.1 hypothetical protein [Spirochaetota bacterium]
MPKKKFVIFLSDSVRIYVYIETDKNSVESFVVKLELYKDGKWVEIERYDVYHGCVHKDILNKNGEKVHTIKYELLDNKSGVNTAINDFKENYQMYIWRFLNGK